MASQKKKNNKFVFNSDTLAYEQASKGIRSYFITFSSYLGIGSLIAGVLLLLVFSIYDNPKEKMLKKELEFLAMEVAFFQQQMNEVGNILEEVQYKDDHIYRTILEVDPVDKNTRMAGIGGAERYGILKGRMNSELVINTAKKFDQIKQQLEIQSRSFDKVFQLSEERIKMLASVPSIQPISNKDLRRMVSGFGYRIHPIYKIKKMHTGLDFSAERGTEIYAAGNGVIVRADSKARGYGNHVVIDHGYGFQTLYAHMFTMNVAVGQKVKRGQVIGQVGSSGSSVAPHLHYEVIKNGIKVNPVNFFYTDLSPDEFEQMVNNSSRPTQSFD